MNEGNPQNVYTNGNQEPCTISPGCELLYYTAESDILNVSNDSVNQCLLKTQIENMNNSLLSNDSFAHDNCTDDSNCNPVENFDLSITEKFARLIMSDQNDNTGNNNTMKSMSGSDPPDDNKLDNLEVPSDVPLQEPGYKANEEAGTSPCLDPSFKEVSLSNSTEANCSQFNEIAEVVDEKPAPDMPSIDNNSKNICEADDSLSGTCQSMETSTFKPEGFPKENLSHQELVTSPNFSGSMLSELGLSDMAGNSSNELSSAWPDESKSNDDISTHDSSSVTKNECSITTCEMDLPSKTGEMTPINKSSNDDISTLDSSSVSKNEGSITTCEMDLPSKTGEVTPINKSSNDDISTLDSSPVSTNEGSITTCEMDLPPKTGEVTPINKSSNDDISTRDSSVTKNEGSVTTCEMDGNVTPPANKSSNDDILFKVPAIPPQVVEPKAVTSVSALTSDDKKEDCFPFCQANELQSLESQPANPLLENQFEPSIVRKELLGDLSFKIPGSDVSSGLPEPRAFTDFREEITLESIEDNHFKVPDPPKDDEEFTDAVQFFQDPSCFQYLENIQTSYSTESIPRSSLYVAFDPLHSKRVSMSKMQSGPVAIISEAESDQNISTPVKKHQVDASIRESLGVLISFDSPKPSSKVSSQAEDLPVRAPAVKQYTEEELQQILKIHELTMQDMYLKKHRELEEEMARSEEKNQDTIKKLASLALVQKITLEELSMVVRSIALQKETLKNKANELEEQNEKLKDDVKTAGEDLQSVESTFSDFHKRYEQCKSMLKTYKENEVHLKNQISDLESKYNTLQEHSHDALEKANLEAINAKKSSEGQVTVLRAQLKKAELKISSLESDLSQVKIENSKLGGICDDLMAKVSEG